MRNALVAGCRVSAGQTHPLVQVETLNDIARDSKRPEYHRVVVYSDAASPRLLAVSTGKQASSRLLRHVFGSTNHVFTWH